MTCRNLLRNRTVELSASERAMLESAITDTRRLPAGAIAVHQHAPVDISILLVKGLMTRHIDSVHSKRHLVAVHVPGDFVDLHAYLLKRLDHDVAALTNVEIAIFPHAVLQRLQAEQQALTQCLWFSTLLDAAMHRQWTFRLASLNAVERLAHFICEMNARLLSVGLSDGVSFELPMTQADLGEVCGLTNVHISRVLRQLRERRLCSVRAGRVEIHDLPALAQAGSFQPDYLYLNGRTAALASGQDWSSHD